MHFFLAVTEGFKKGCYNQSLGHLSLQFQSCSLVALCFLSLPPVFWEHSCTCAGGVWEVFAFLALIFFLSKQFLFLTCAFDLCLSVFYVL